MEVWLRYDLRSPGFGASTPELVSVSLDQLAWAEDNGFDTVQLSEHHGFADGYNPSPLVLGGAVAARTSRIRLNPPLILPLHDPVRLAEDCCVLDNISGGRLDITVVAGYIPTDFDMYGVALADRGRLLDAKLEVLTRAFRGEPFEYEGRRGTITPRPVQPGGPRIFIGGSIMATARRAARYGHGYYPMDQSPKYLEEYRRACAELGKEPGKLLLYSPVLFFHVSEDPDAAWARIAPHALHEANEYAEAARSVGQMSPFPAAMDADALRATGAYQVMTPEECVAYARAERDAGRYLTMTPLMGGMPPDLGWESLELFAARVLPALEADG